MTKNEKLEKAYALRSLEEVRDLYRGWAASYDTDFAEAGGFRLPALIGEAFGRLGGAGPVLDAGCGTGLVADHFPAGLVVDGVDISAEMLEAARAKGRYRSLFEADLTARLPFEDAAYNGLVSSGTFTHGHVGPEAIAELLRCLAPGSLAAITTNAAYMVAVDFGSALASQVAEGRIGQLATTEERIYANPEGAPEGHAGDTGFIVTFRRL